MADILLQDAKTGAIPYEQSELILKEFMQQSAVSQLAQYETMTKPKKTFTYLADGPGAYWVGEGEKIKTNKATWLTATMQSKKMAVIIPMSKEFLAYSVPNAFAELKPAIAESFAVLLDQAAMFGTSSPFGTGVSLFERAEKAKKTVKQTTDVYGNLNSLISLVEDEDLEPNGFLATKSFKRDLRGARDLNGLPIFNDPGNGVTASALGLPIGYADKKSMDKEKALAFTGAWKYARYGVLAGVEYTIDESATLSTIKNADGSDINLFEQDLVALKVTFQVGFTTLSEDAFAALLPGAKAPVEGK